MAAIDLFALGLLSAKLGPDDLLMQVAAVADYSEVPPLPLTLILDNGCRMDGVVGSDMAMATAADEPIKKPIEDMFRTAIDRAPPQEAEEFEEGARTLGGRGIAPWLTDLHEALKQARDRCANDGNPLKWSELDEDDVVLLTQFAQRTAITIRNARLTLPTGESHTVPVARVSLNSVTCWWPGAFNGA